ncbi:sigma-70 family RNA polymerase sigma factor [Streptomyces sp. NRRL F-2890]|uniref:sigma-70 family RNA polymerase sigma factor n=1 Tax=Streptomyces sp. NRRL F-2890 TaxID=1463845 RepID=UPI001F34E2BE|nr:sigma-70 family RNA polymerase sigma factor [Streptomyces sp. NRRL F-2890]
MDDEEAAAPAASKTPAELEAELANLKAQLKRAAAPAADKSDAELEEATRLELDAVSVISDPVDRLLEASRLSAHFKDLEQQMQALRNSGVNEALRLERVTASALAKRLGITRGRVSQLAKAGPPIEQAFFGHGELTVALGGKVEAGKERPGPVIAQEDFQTYEHLRELAEDLGLRTRYETIPPPGIVDLNRDDLLVICGPRLSPLIGQILASDPHLQFAADEQGWHLNDLKAEKTYRSPIDAGDSGDYAYFGRLPRPDGKGTFLYIAGIHAMGSGGVVHWLAQEIADLYKEVKTRRFSVLIQSRFDPETREITESQRVTPIYFTEGK